MRAGANKAETDRETRRPLWKKILWLLVIYSASIMALGIVASLFRMMMTAAGMRSH